MQVQEGGWQVMCICRFSGGGLELDRLSRLIHKEMILRTHLVTRKQARLRTRARTKHRQSYVAETCYQASENNSLKKTGEEVPVFIL